MHNTEYQLQGRETNLEPYSNFHQPPPPPVFDQLDNAFVIDTTPPLNCIKCGAISEVEFHYVRRNYVPAYAYLTVILSPLVLVIAALILRVRHELNLPFCPGCWARFNRTDTLAGIWVVLFVSLLVGGIANILISPRGIIFLVPMILSGVMMIYQLRKKKSDSPIFKKIDGREVVVTDPVCGDIHFPKIKSS